MKSDVAILIDLLPWLVRHQGVSIAQAANHFGITEKQIVSLLTTATLTGPSQYGGGLVDLSIDDGFIYVQDAQRLDRSVRLTALEMATLLGGLRYLQQVEPAIAGQAQALADRLVDKLGGSEIALDVVADKRTSMYRDQIESALLTGSALELEYAGDSAQEISHRVVVPQELQTVDGVSYLVAWCGRSEAIRSFRLDRILQLAPSATELTVPQPSPMADPGFPAKLLTSPGRLGLLDERAVLHAEPAADGRISVQIQVWSTQWLLSVIAASGGDLELVEPVELREQLRSWLTQQLAHHQQVGSLESEIGG